MITQPPPRELPSNHLAAELTQRQIQHYRLTRDVMSLEREIIRLEAAIVQSRKTESALGAVLDAAPAGAPAATDAPGIKSVHGMAVRSEHETGKPAAETMREYRAGQRREFEAAAPKPQPKPAATPKPKPKPKRVRNKGPSFTASGKRRGRPPGTRNQAKPKPAIVTARDGDGAAERGEGDMTQQQRSAAETIQAARMATGG